MSSVLIKNSTSVPTEIINGAWLEAHKMWGNPLNRIYSRVGSLPPRIAHYLIMKYSDPGDVVFDPFSGRGTIPFQACLNGRYGIGNDISKEAFVVTRALTDPPRRSYFLKYLKRIKSKVEGISDESISDDLNNIELRTFFEKNTLAQILKLRKVLLDKPYWARSDFFLIAITLGLLHGSSKLHFSIPCSHTYSMAPRYVRNYIKKYNDKNPDSLRFYYVEKDILESIFYRAENILKIPLPSSFIRGESLSLDAIKATKKLIRKGKMVDLIVTSPPYFDAQKYAWDNWLRLWFLGENYKEVAKKLFQTSSKSIYMDRILIYIERLYDVLKDDSACFIIVGDVKRNGEVINTAEEIAERILESKIGFKVEKIMRDEIPKGRKTLTYVDRNNGVRYERILELHKGKVSKRNNHIKWY